MTHLDQKIKVLPKSKTKRFVVISFGLLIGAIIMTTSSINAVLDDNYHQYSQSAQVDGKGRFSNVSVDPDFSLSKTLKIIKRSLFEKKLNTQPTFDIPLKSISLEQLLALPDSYTSVVRLGHSTLLIKISGKFWLIDPVFGERASPFSFIGPKRFHAPPIDLASLPAISGVIISHNHYDHLDEFSIKALHENVEHFIMPLGNAAQVIDWGVAAEKITELDWWQSIKVADVEVTATPSQHFSGRGLSDRNKTLWSSWVIKSSDTSLFYSGDSGYFSGFKEIGDKYGPFDLTMMETGAYDKDWHEVHMTPEESVRAHRDLRGKKMLPVHNGTFDLAFHSWSDPFEQVAKIATTDLVDVLTPNMGQVISLENEQSVEQARNNFWWRQ